MKKILQNFSDAAEGKRTSTAQADVNDMKTILESFNAVEECGSGAMEGGMPPQPAMDQGSPVSMNISLNARGKENVADLVDLMKMAGIEPKPSADMDMLKPGIQDKPCPVCGKVHVGAGAGCMGEEEDFEEDWDNSPEEEYSDHETMTRDLSGGMNREKKMYKASQRGDNAMAVESIKERLWAALNEKKSPAGGPACWDGKKIHPTKPTKMKGGKRVNNCIDANSKDGK